MSLQVLNKKLATRVAPTLARAVSTSTENYSVTQAALGRPLSPHVTVYHFPISAISSIANRFCGVGMSFAFVGGAALGFVGADVPALIYMAQDAIPFFAPASKMLVTFPISYHMLCAARHSLWTYKPELINNTDGPNSSYAIFAASGLLSLGAAAYTIKTPVKEEAEDQ
jgi:succinate dehydrogenase (ubiquinone) cytochrome b560 subunit